MRFVRWFAEVGLGDVGLVGGKVASLGEMIRELSPLGVRVPDGFAITAEGYRHFIDAHGLDRRIRDLLAALGRKDDVHRLVRCSSEIRALITNAELPSEIADETIAAYEALSQRSGPAHDDQADVAVRSSATAEDLPGASFAGQQDTFLNVRGTEALLSAVKRCFASLFTARAISYRAHMGFDGPQLALSVGVQKMVRSDLASSGVIFTLDPESGHRGVVLITSSYGLGEAVVQGQVVPDQYYVHKQALKEGHRALVWKTLGSKERRMIYSDHGTVLAPVPQELRGKSSLSDDEVLQLARWSLQIEEHYSRSRGQDSPMDVEWGKDGESGQLFILQARPETVHSNAKGNSLRIYKLLGKGEPLAQGLAVGAGLAIGTARVIKSPAQFAEFGRGEVLVTENTDPDWEPIMKMAAGIVTERGGRTSHAAIVAREMGIPAVVGTGDACSRIESGAQVTLSCAEGEQGRVYRGAMEYEVEEVDREHVPRPQTQMMLNVGNPEQAFQTAMLPNDGVGLARMEFIFASWVKVHPLALTRFAQLDEQSRAAVESATRGYDDKTEYFVDKLAQGIGTIAAAFHPKPVILRLSDFKSNEYATLLGGKQFEPSEENPMIGWRGASRYYHPDYKEGFMLELRAIKRVRDEYGLRNLKLMVPFCRTPEEGRKVIGVLREGGLIQHRDGLEVYVMAELPSNVFLADQYADIFDGFSIGSNDLTQLILGVDRDSALVAPLFSERNAAVLHACARIIDAAHRKGRKVGICGQAPSDFPDFAAFLVEQGIDSISLIPDSLITTSERVLEAERQPPPQRPQRRAGDARMPAGSGKPAVAGPAEAWSDTEPFVPGKE